MRAARLLTSCFTAHVPSASGVSFKKRALAVSNTGIASSSAGTSLTAIRCRSSNKNFNSTLIAFCALRTGSASRYASRDLARASAPSTSLIFYCPAERVLVSADALWENGFGVIFPELDGESGFAEERATLDVIAGLDVRLVIPGHGRLFSDVAGALARARSRLAYLEADPVRNAQNAIKVLLKFLLLERQRIALSEVPALLLAMPVFETANARFLKETPDTLATWAIKQLTRSLAARIEGEHLLNQ